MELFFPVTSTPLDRARALLETRFGHAAFRPGQERAVSSILAGRDTLVILPTGGGKSLCYQVPALVLDGLTVVLSPLISLMKDQVDQLVARGVPATFINSSLGAAEISSRLAQVQRGEIKLLYVAPERFDAGGAGDRIAAAGVSLLAVDEAHCISEWGHDFRPSYRRVREIRERLGTPPTVALTATATPEVRRDIAHSLGLREPDVIVTGFDRPNLRWHVIRTKNDAEKDGTLAHLLERHTGAAIVYASTRKTVDRVAARLARSGLRAAAYHAGLDDERRREVQDAFMGGDLRVIVATNAFGMGIDKRDVRLVVHHAMPGSLEAYYQEAGRAGRDGATADCVLLHAFQDRFTHEFFIRAAHPLRNVVEAVFAAACRRAGTDGLVDGDIAALAASAAGKVSDREADSAVRILVTAGAMHHAVGSTSSARVRLLATPERIREELGGEENMERDLLRALWRLSRGAIADGAIVDLGALPPGLGDPFALTERLDALEQRQFLVWNRVGEGLVVTDPAAPLSRWSVDWTSLDRRRQSEIGQLEVMQKYAYTERCRRSFVLRHFGDPAATPTCAQCDNCLHLAHAAVNDAPAPPSAPRPRKKVPIRSKADDDAPLDDAAQALLDRLRALRSTLARAGSVPAYVVFPDRTLRAMARERPRSPGALADLHGVGPAKMEKYGEAFLGVIRAG